jgi:hypothetical protein
MRSTLVLAGAVVVLSSLAMAGSDAGTKGAAMKGAASVQAEGSFDVKVVSLADDAGTGLGRMSLQKTWHGDVEAVSGGEMLTAMAPDKISGAYVAVERVTGKVGTRKGSFSLVHRGVMTKGQQELSISVVPGSGTEQLQGLEGTVTIRIEPGGKHFYVLSGTLPGN